LRRTFSALSWLPSNQGKSKVTQPGDRFVCASAPELGELLGKACSLHGTKQSKNRSEIYTSSYIVGLNNDSDKTYHGLLASPTTNRWCHQFFWGANGHH
jgi:hypothetical protein